MFVKNPRYRKERWDSCDLELRDFNRFWRLCLSYISCWFSVCLMLLTRDGRMHPDQFRSRRKEIYETWSVCSDYLRFSTFSQFSPSWNILNLVGLIRTKEDQSCLMFHPSSRPPPTTLSSPQAHLLSNLFVRLNPSSFLCPHLIRPSIQSSFLMSSLLISSILLLSVDLIFSPFLSHPFLILSNFITFYASYHTLFFPVFFSFFLFSSVYSPTFNR